MLAHLPIASSIGPTWVIQPERWLRIRLEAQGPSNSYSPPARWGLLDFITAVPAPSPPPSPRPPSPPPPLPPLPRPLPPCQLFTLRQLPRAVGTAGPQLPASDLSGHGWTSTARFWAQWAMLDLNQGPSEPSGHCWTSTWDLPSSVDTAGPQRPDGMPEYMPERLPEYMPDRLPENMPHRMPHRMPKYMRERMPHRMPEYMPDRTPKYIPDKMLEDMPDRISE